MAGDVVAMGTLPGGHSVRRFRGCLALLAVLLAGCAAAPQTPYIHPPITITTTPDGADIFVNGTYVGPAPLQIPIPTASVPDGKHYRTVVGRADKPLRIEAQLVGHETRIIEFGDYHPPVREVSRSAFAATGVTRTIPGYYTFTTELDIELTPR